MKRSEDWLERSCWICRGSLCGSALDRLRNNDVHICDGVKTPDAYLRLAFLVAFLFSSTSTAFGQFNDKSVDLAALPKVPDEFTVTLFASEPMVRQPCSMAFDERGRLFVGMGPQYRNPTPETPGDTVVIVQDTDGDGRADDTKEFATGFNAIQGLAWHGRDLWVANAPDLTMVRDRDGDAGTASGTSIAAVRDVMVLSNAGYKVVPLGFAIGSQAYLDRSYRLRSVAVEMVGCDLIQTANDDDGSHGELWLTAETRVPVRVWVGIDARQNKIPGWLLKGFQKTEFIAEIDEGAIVVTNSGHIHSGVLLEESGLMLSLGLSTGERHDIPKASIEERKSSSQSAMPEMNENLTPQQIADLTTFLLSMRMPLTTASAAAPTLPNTAASNFSFEEKSDRLSISLTGHQIVDFIFRDDKILRPYFANARLPDGQQVTRNHPPVSGVDAVDHDTMHPGIWLAFGDINGQDYWRNKAAMEHVRFISPPTTVDGKLRFATECRLKKSTGESLCLLNNHFTLTARPNGWMLIWEAAFYADQHAIVFGDQEEMGFGARVASPFTEQNGGMLSSSTGKKTAKETWGQPAAWCDYSGTSGERSCGILLMASQGNFRESWWHNRDYGVFVANPFGREAMKQGARSTVTVAKGETFRIAFGALVHHHQTINLADEYMAFEKLSVADEPDSNNR